MGALRQGALADTLKRFPMAAQLFLALFPGKIAKLTEETRQNEDLAIELTRKRIARHDSARKDFMTRILEQRDPAKVSDLQLAAHASDFVIAGSETSATAIACILFHLMKDPAVMAKLCCEVRREFQSYNDICSQSTLPLAYLKAVILEGLRIYPPLPFALPRVVPEGGDTVDGIYLPAGVSSIRLNGPNPSRVRVMQLMTPPPNCRPLSAQIRWRRACIPGTSASRWPSNQSGGSPLTDTYKSNILP